VELNTGIGPSTIVLFGPFEVNVTDGELRKHGVRVQLARQPFQVLTALVDRPGGVVSRDDLRQQLWADNTFVDFEKGLNAAMNKLRQALGDSAEKPRYIETVPGRGYRLSPLFNGPRQSRW
jgi:DNA-binding winged helix-turn-helix (wHTH) protein